MTAPILWPAALPLWPQVQGFGAGMQPARHSFQPESGLPISRRMQSARVDVFNVAFAPLSQSDVELFRTFHDVTLGQGSLKFAMVHPVRRVVRDAQFSGEPSETILVPGQSPKWAISFQVLMIDVDPAYFADITLANGFVEYTGS